MDGTDPKRPIPPGPRVLEAAWILPSLTIRRWSAESLPGQLWLALSVTSRTSKPARSRVAPLRTVGLGGKTPAVRVSEAGMAARVSAAGAVVGVLAGRVAAERTRAPAR